MAIRYHDLEIEIDRCCCGEQEIRVLESTYDRPRARFELGKEQRTSLEAKVEEFDGLLIQGSEHASRRRQLAEEIGIELKEILFSGPIGRTFELCRAALGTGEGLRLRLSFGNPYDRLLGGLPWELLCNPQTGRFIGNRPESPVVRYLDIGEKIQPLPVTPPLKVLGFVAAPDPGNSHRFSYSEIDAEEHRAILEEAIRPAKFIELRCFPRKGETNQATLGALHDELREAELAGVPYHALHFVGHGAFDADGEGALFFEGDDSEHLVTGNELARQLTKDIRLVVLASCGTGKIPIVRRGAQHPFAGVASALVAADIPAVVAMQFSISEDAAKAFAGPFYHAIDHDDAIDAAVTEGRLAIDARGGEGDLEWATPVLFLRSPDGRVLNLQTTRVPPKTVAVYNVLDMDKGRLKHVHSEVDLRDYFERGDGKPRVSTEWNGAIMLDLRATLLGKALAGSPLRLELAAPLSIAFACGFLLPVNERRSIDVRQGDETWSFEGEPPAGAPFWLPDAAARELVPPDFPFAEESDDIAVVVESARPAIGAVADYLRRDDIEPSPPRVGEIVYACFDRAGRYTIRGGAHAHCLAEELVARIAAAARDRGYPTVHLFLAGPNGLALAIGRLCHVLPRIQLYEFDKEKKHHKTYEPSITLVPPEMGGVP